MKSIHKAMKRYYNSPTINYHPVMALKFLCVSTPSGPFNGPYGENPDSIEDV